MLVNDVIDHLQGGATKAGGHSASKLSLTLNAEEASIRRGTGTSPPGTKPATLCVHELGIYYGKLILNLILETKNIFSVLGCLISLVKIKEEKCAIKIEKWSNK